MAHRIKVLGIITVSTAGTRVALSASTLYAAGVYIEALKTNSGTIYMGDSTVASNNYSSALAAGEGIGIEGPKFRGQEEELNLADFYIDASANSQSVMVSYLEKR